MRTTTALAAAALLVTACGQPGADTSRAKSTTDTAQTIAQGADPAHALFGCLDGDSAVYSTVDTDSTVRLTLWHAGDGIDGSSITSAGDSGRSVPLARVTLVGRDSVILDMPHDASSRDTSSFAGRVTCDSLWGRQQTLRTSPARDVSYRRLR